MKELNQGFARMREYPVGSVCVIVEAYPEYLGKECTIVKEIHLQKCRDQNGVVLESNNYSIHMQGFGNKVFAAKHEELRLKKFPGQLQSWLAEKMDKLVAPNPFIVLEGV